MLESESSDNIDPYSGEPLPTQSRGSINSLLNHEQLESANASEDQPAPPIEQVDNEPVSERTETGPPKESTSPQSFHEYLDTANPRKPKKRRIEVKPSVFSLRRAAEPESEAKPRPSVERPVEKPNNILSQWKGASRPQKKPKSRASKEEQLRRAQEYRRREEEAEQRNLALERKRIAEREQANVDDIVRSHYNKQVQFARREKRTESAIYKLRNFNNIIKYMLIGKFSKPGDRVLEMACGKGGDLPKWKQANIQSYIGLDISESSIREAVKRHERSREQFEAYFLACDCFGGDIWQELSIFLPGRLRFPVDVVSIQFALHYAFESEAKIRNTLKTILRALKPGGFFIGTIPSSDYIRYRLKKLKEGERKWGNPVYSVEFVNPPPLNGSFNLHPYGNTYIYYLKDAVDHVPEYVVPFDILRSLADEYGLELRFKKPFFELYLEQIPEWYKKLSPGLLQGLKRSDGKLGLEGPDKEAAEFYLAFAFEKVASTA